MPADRFPDGACLVMAHPDDEALWASSILAKVRQVVLCYGDVWSRPDWSEGRRRSIAEHPMPNLISLGIREAEVFGGARWPAPIETHYGLEVRRGSRSQRGFSKARYRRTHGQLIERLRPLLAGVAVVVTHSPWGEYGHEEHVQVFRAVADLRVEIGFEIWVPGYVSDKSYPLMLRHLARLDRNLPPQGTDSALGGSLKALYAANGCWTWFDDYVWPPREYFYRWMGPEDGPTKLRPGAVIDINLIWLNWQQQPPRRALPIRRFVKWARRLVPT